MFGLISLRLLIKKFLIKRRAKIIDMHLWFAGILLILINIDSFQFIFVTRNWKFCMIYQDFRDKTLVKIENTIQWTNTMH